MNEENRKVKNSESEDEGMFVVSFSFRYTCPLYIHVPSNIQDCENADFWPEKHGAVAIKRISIPQDPFINLGHRWMSLNACLVVADAH